MHPSGCASGRRDASTAAQTQTGTSFLNIITRGCGALMSVGSATSVPFQYDHPTVEACQRSGCTREHLVLRDVAALVGRAWEGPRPGRNLRNVIRSEIVFGRSLKGTRNVPCVNERATNSPILDSGKPRVDYRRVRTVPLDGASPTLRSLVTERVDHFWHAGDPDIVAIKRLLITEIPANASLGQDCAICLGSHVHDTHDADEVYCREEVCPHNFHATCIMDWFQQCESAGLARSCPECRRTHPATGGAQPTERRASAVPTGTTVACVACCSCGSASASGGASGSASASGSGCGGSVGGDGSNAMFGSSDLGSSDLGSSDLGGRRTGESADEDTGASTERARKRRTAELCELVDTTKGSLASRRKAAAQRCQLWEVGDAVEARFGAQKGGAAWYRGRVWRVHDLGDEETDGPRRQYDIKYDDGDEEMAVLPRYVRGLCAESIAS